MIVGSRMDSVYTPYSLGPRSLAMKTMVTNEKAALSRFPAKRANDPRVDLRAISTCDKEGYYSGFALDAVADYLRDDRPPRRSRVVADHGAAVASIESPGGMV